MNISADADLLVGADTSDDAAVYRLNDQQALISTVDFFTPMVDDPFAFGQVAAANALSDVYAMGGRPLLALNLVVFPAKLPLSILEDILRGGAQKVEEAGARLAGGHSIADESPIYGLAVNGLVDPGKMWTNRGAKPGDVLVLTKPLGSGTICTAIKGERASVEAIDAVTETMSKLNKEAAEFAAGLAIHSCTDITGFGLLGHATEVALASGVAMEIHSAAVPLLAAALEYAAEGMLPGGAHRNRKYYQSRVEFSASVTNDMQSVLFDPQTSGGLLFSLPAKEGAKLTQAGLGTAVGKVLPKEKGTGLIRVT